MLRDSPQTIYLKDYQPPVFLIKQADLHFYLEADKTRVRSILSVCRNPQSKSAVTDIRLDGEELTLIGVSLDGQLLDSDAYHLDESSLTLSCVPDEFTLEIEVALCPEKNTALEGLYKSGVMYCTQCEAEGFRKITYFLDRPDVMTRFSTTITASKSLYPVLLSNGNLICTEQLDGDLHRVCWRDPFPKPSYLFALVAGDLRAIEDSYTTASGRVVKLCIYVEPENIDKCDHAMGSLKRAMAWDEEHYGREYDLDIYMIVAVNDFNMGAMENKGLNIFNSKYVLARPDTATDTDFQGIEAVIAHEYFHNWTGNRITCRDWFQLSLKEGLTVFRDQEFSADQGSRGVKRIEDVRLLRAHQFAEDAGPMAHPIRPDSYIEINNFYTVTVYEKGAEVVRMQHNLLGADNYRKGTDRYFERFDGQAVTTDDFVACMASAGDSDLTQFKHWYSQAGTPELSVSDQYDAKSGSYSLTIEQSCQGTPGQDDKVPLHIPISVGLLDASGSDMLVQFDGCEPSSEGSYLLQLREPSQTFRFSGVKERPVPSLLRGFTAPVKLNYPYSDQDLMFLVAHDSDGFCRWDAAQSLLQRILIEKVTNPSAVVPDGFIDAFRRVLTERGSDQALQAELLTLPAEGYLGDLMAQVDVDGIHRAREGLKSELASSLAEEFKAVYLGCQELEEYQLDSASIGRRALKNLCLGYLMQLDSTEAHQLCIAQYRANHNMTDVISALSLLLNSGCEQRDELLDHFYQKWQSDPLVLDKWFTIQALSKRQDTLSRVQRLKEHPDFSMTNPNRVRSLIGAFCSANGVRFHAENGAGYQFLGDAVLELDALNPQVASRMLRLVARWNRYDESRQQLMKNQIRRIVESKGISKDVFEIASKSLG